MKLNLLSLAIVALVGTSFAVPPKNLKVKHVQAPKFAKHVKAPTRGQGPSGSRTGIQIRNEGYTPGI